MLRRNNLMTCRYFLFVGTLPANFCSETSDALPEFIHLRLDFHGRRRLTIEMLLVCSNRVSSLISLVVFECAI